MLGGVFGTSVFVYGVGYPEGLKVMVRVREMIGRCFVLWMIGTCFPLVFELCSLLWSFWYWGRLFVMEVGFRVVEGRDA
jgi:hypothetical protein